MLYLLGSLQVRRSTTNWVIIRRIVAKTNRSAVLNEYGDQIIHSACCILLRVASKRCFFCRFRRRCLSKTDGREISITKSAVDRTAGDDCRQHGAFRPANRRRTDSRSAFDRPPSRQTSSRSSSPVKSSIEHGYFLWSALPRPPAVRINQSANRTSPVLLRLIYFIRSRCRMKLQQLRLSPHADRLMLPIDVVLNLRKVDLMSLSFRRSGLPTIRHQALAGLATWWLAGTPLLRSEWSVCHSR